MNVIEKVFGTHSERELKRILPIVDKIESLRDDMMALTDEQLKDKTKEYKTRLAQGETLDDLLPEAYATVREAGRRVLNMEHFRRSLPETRLHCTDGRSVRYVQKSTDESPKSIRASAFANAVSGLAKIRSCDIFPAALFTR